jgi:dynein heavy chain 1
MATEKIEAYLAATCPVVLEGGSAEQVRASLKESDAQRAVAQFANDTQNVLCVRYSSALDDAARAAAAGGGGGGGGTLAAPAGSPFTFSSEVTYVGEPLPTVVFIKKAPGALDAAKRIGSQVQMMTVNSNTAGSDDADEAKAAGGGAKDASAEESKTVADVGVATLELFRGYISQVMAPMVRSYASARTQGADASGKESKANDEKVAAATGFANLTRKINELDIAFTHCQQNFQVPEVLLQPDPDVLEASQQCQAAGKVLPLAQLGVEGRAKDPDFLNQLTASVKKWIKDISMVTNLVRDPSLGNTMVEVNFWKAMDKSLESIKRQVESPYIQLTFDILHQANKFSVRFGFEAGTSLVPRIEQVRNIMNLMKDFPIDALLTATSLPSVIQALKALLLHLNRIKTIEECVRRFCCCGCRWWRRRSLVVPPPPLPLPLLLLLLLCCGCWW